MRSAKLFELLQRSSTGYRNRAVKTTQVIEELIQMDMDELSFYDALATNEVAVRELGDATPKEITVELTQNLPAVC